MTSSRKETRSHHPEHRIKLTAFYCAPDVARQAFVRRGRTTPGHFQISKDWKLMRAIVGCVIVCILLIEFGGCLDRGCAVNSAGATKEMKKDEDALGSHLPHHRDVGSDGHSSVAAARPR
jgi:hypothetical protein